MTLPQANALFAYWKRSPPVHELLAAFLGVEDREPQQREQTLEEFLAEANQLNGMG